MTERHDPHADATRLGEDAAHRLLARAVELDAAGDAARDTLSVAQLREVARDAGISEAAFDAAVRELRRTPDAAPATPPPTRRAARWRAARETIARNALALAGGWALLSAASRGAYALGADWPGHQGAVIAANVLAVLLARRLGARAVGVLLAVLAAAQLGEYPIHLAFGIQTVQGGPTKWALVLASLLGIGFGALLLGRGRRAGAGRASPAPPAPAAPLAADAPAQPTAEPTARPRHGSLRLRHA